MANKQSIYVQLSQSKEEGLEGFLEQCKDEAEAALAYFVQKFGFLGKAASKGLGNVGKAIQKSLSTQVQQSTQKITGTIRRSLMDFDQLNRLVKRTGSGSATAKVVKENEELTQSVGNLFEKIGLWGKEMNDKLFTPMLKWSSGSLLDGLKNIGVKLGIIKDQTNGNVTGARDYLDILNQMGMKTGLLTELVGFFNQELGLIHEGMVNSGVAALSTADQVYQLGATISFMSQSSWEKLQSTWGGSAGWFTGQVVNPVGQAFSTFWSKLQTDCTNTWQTTKDLFSGTFRLVTDNVGKAWQSVYGKLGKDGDLAADMQTGVLEGLKSTINAVIKGINRVTVEPFSGLNKVLEKIQKIKVGILSPFSFLSWRVSVPQIPMLAQGAVLPANKPFLAMVGDQTHGTNIEAPLSTIQEAVALTMEDYAAGNMAGHEATVSVLRDILGAVLGISIGDNVIAAAYDRHRSKMSVVYGK